MTCPAYIVETKEVFNGNVVLPCGDAVIIYLPNGSSMSLRWASEENAVAVATHLRTWIQAHLEADRLARKAAT